MFSFLKSLFQRKARPAAKPAAAPDRFAQLNAVAPLRSAVESPGSEGSAGAEAAEWASSDPHSFVCREPILNRGERIAGYEFLLNPSLQRRLAGKSPGLRLAYDDALMRNLAAVGVDSLLGHRLAFVAISPLSAGNENLAGLPVGNTVLMIDPLAEESFEARDLKSKLLAAKARGFRLGYRLRAGLPDDDLLPLCEFVQFSIPDYDGLEIADWVRRLRKLSATPPVLIAGNIPSLDDFQVCYRAGFDFFHGPFVARRENWHPPQASIDHGRIAYVLKQLRSGVENDALAESVRQDAVVTYKLLRYINSPANGLRNEIKTIEQCLLLLGRERFYRWLSLLLFDVQKSGYTERVLTEQALARASLMERLGQRAQRPDLNTDHLFLTGLFSLLSALLGRPMAEVLTSVAVPPEVSAALLDNSGPLAPFLALVVACENNDQPQIAACAAVCGLKAAAVNQDLLAALIWANTVSELDAA